jgi:hypothetical protein
MKTLRLLFMMVTALCICYLAKSQPPEEFDNPKVDFYWIAFDYSTGQFGDTVAGMNASGPVDDPGEDGTWSAYVDDITMLPWFNTWFYNGPLNLNHMKKIRMGFWVSPLVQGPLSTIDWVVNWSSSTWPTGSGYPGPGNEKSVIRSPWQHMVVPGLPPPGIFIELYYEIPYFNPEWISVDVIGNNIQILHMPTPPPPTSPELLYWWNNVAQTTGTPPPGGIIVHECLPIPGGVQYDFGDAPEGDTAYLEGSVIGNFPTCMGIGPLNSFIKHGFPNPLFFGGYIDGEPDGNAGWCPTFGPNQYNSDECGTIPYSFPPNPDPNIGLVDEGLFLPVPNTLGLLKPSFYGYFVCGAGNRQALDTVCHVAQWGQDIDIWIDSRQAAGGFLNILFDWNQDGDWNDIVQCVGTPVSEHAIINWPVPGGFWGPASVMPQVLPSPPLVTAPIQLGPNSGYVWARFSLTDQPVPVQWDGSGAFAEGETEDYLLYIATVKAVIPLANWALFLGISLIVMFTLLIWWRKR